MSLFADYTSAGFDDEMMAADGRPHAHCRKLFQRLGGLSLQDFLRRVQLADLMLVNQGITFNVYSDDRGTEKPWPFDLVPRVIPAGDWDHIERGLTQRMTALNLFLHDLYHDQKILKDGIVPRELIVSAPHFRSELLGATPTGGAYVSICGSDLIRSDDGTYFVLEDNLRVPSGVSCSARKRLAALAIDSGSSPTLKAATARTCRRMPCLVMHSSWISASRRASDSSRAFCLTGMTKHPCPVTIRNGVPCALLLEPEMSSASLGAGTCQNNMVGCSSQNRATMTARGPLVSTITTWTFLSMGSSL